MQNHAKDRELLTYRTHWASFPGTFWDKPAEWHDNFLSLAVQYNLYAYVQQVMETSDNRALKNKQGRPLLDYAVNPIPAERYLLSPEMVGILLHHSAKLNKAFRIATAWENALVFLMKNEVTIWKGKNWKRGLIKWLDIFEQMVDAGANFNAACVLPSGDFPVLCG